MTEEERKTMIMIGKALTEHVKTCQLIQESRSGPVATPTPFDIPRPSTLSVVEHQDFTKRFKMEVGFAKGTLWDEEQRKDHSVKLLSEMEEVFAKYGVVNMYGKYDRYGVAQTA